MTADSGAMERCLPPELAADYEPLALLKEGRERQTLLLQDKRTGEELVLRRFVRPAADTEKKFVLLSRLTADGIPKMRRYFLSDGVGYLLREYVQGETLLDLLQKRGPFSPEETARIGLSLCRTLQAIHSQDPPLIHRDIKAENVIRTPAGKYVLIDFDISRFYDEQDTRDTELRVTAFSAPPEQFGYRQTDTRSDIYALGVLLHELSTGESMLEKGNVPPPLEAVVRRCTRFDPKDRYQSAAALERDLKRAAAGRKPGVLRGAVLALGAVLAAGALAAAVWVPYRQQAARIEGAYTFHSPAIEAEVCRQLDKEPGTVTLEDLEQISGLYLCGSEHFDSWDQMDVHGAELTIDGGPAPTGGTVDTLEDIPNFPNLLELALCNQQITDLSPLAGKWVLRLALHGNDITDLSPLSQCQHMMDLYIGDNPVQDLSPLTQSRALRTLCAGDTRISDLTAVAQIPKLEYLWIMDCPELADLSSLRSMDWLVCLFVRPAHRQDMDLIGSLTGLEQLYLWADEPLADMTALSGLTGLTQLFVDAPVESLSGLETMTRLEFLDVRGTADLDPTPLKSLTALTHLNVGKMDTAALADVLPALPFLEQVGCAPEQMDELRQMLDGRPDVMIAAWE